MTNNLKVSFLLQMKDMHLLISYFIPFSRSRRTEKKLSIRNTLSGEIFVGRNYWSGEIFVTRRKTRHFRSTNSFARRKFRSTKFFSIRYRKSPRWRPWPIWFRKLFWGGCIWGKWAYLLGAL